MTRKRSSQSFTLGSWLRTPRATVPDLQSFATARGFVRRGGEIDYHNAAHSYIRAFNEGVFGRISFETPMTPKERKARNAYERERRRLHRMHRFEEAARAKGFLFVGGIDEVGRGPLAGPVVAACVVAPEPLLIKGLNDSKQVRPELRVELAEIIKVRAAAWVARQRLRRGDRPPQHLLGQRARDGTRDRRIAGGA